MDWDWSTVIAISSSYGALMLIVFLMPIVVRKWKGIKTWH